MNNTSNLICEYCGLKTNKLYWAEHPRILKEIQVCEDCECGPVNGEYYRINAELNRGQKDEDSSS